ncbi:hypothetical protein [Spirillospora sp. NPDC048819]|uniref:hypothetical protein n=1 Tax=Spirillospora sp. NPDC048819 TaxID=3155268 RepID=UPI0033D57DA7
MSDAEVLGAWWRSMVDHARQATTVRALWFGLVELAEAEGARWHLYVGGCREFDREDDSCDWAAEPAWWPEERYLFLAGLNDPAGNGAEAMLAHAADMVRSLAPEQSWPGLLEGVAVGFDDGDFVLTWTA